MSIIKKQRDMERLIFLGFLIALSVIFSACQISGDNVPSQWKIDYSRKKIHELRATLGEPDDDISEKQFMSWSERDGEIMKVLKVICSRNCGDDEYPNQVLFYTYSNNGKRSKYTVLFDKEK